MKGFTIQIIFVIAFSLQSNAGFNLDGISANFPRNDDPNVLFPMVTTPLGQLRGKSMFSRSGKVYYAFNGIPYAEPPGRFQSAVAVQPWEGLLDARSERAVCPQVDRESGAVQGEEDCLFLNVFFPHYDRCQNVSESGGLPVSLHIHGGGYIALSGSSFGQAYLMDECLVYVSINYRLGALGFLTSGDEVLPGNLALKDMVQALKWTRQYISYFRGDPNAISINGESAGASAVSHIIASPSAAGMFVAATMMSASALTPWSIQENPLRYAKMLAERLNCTSTETSTELRDCLLQKDTQDIVRGQNYGQMSPFAPVIEPKTAVEPFQTENPAVLMRNGDFSRVPLLTGFLQDEGATYFAGLVLLDPTLLNEFNSSWLEIAPVYFQYDDLDLAQTEKDRISRDIRQFYFGDKDIGLETRQELVDLYSDRTFVQGVLENVELHSKFAPVYAYWMTYKGGPSGAAGFGYEIPVIAHGDDSQYIYPGAGVEDFNFGTEQYEFSKKIVRHWTHFTGTGVPATIEGEEPWIPTTGDIYHKLDVKGVNVVNPVKERQEFWRNLGLYDYELAN